MSTNVGTPDRIIRLVVAALAVFGAVSTSGALSIILWIVAAIMALTAVVGFCPIYRMLGMSTCKVKS